MLFGDYAKGLAGAQIDVIHFPSLLHWCSHSTVDVCTAWPASMWEIEASVLQSHVSLSWPAAYYRYLLLLSTPRKSLLLSFCHVLGACCTGKCIPCFTCVHTLAASSQNNFKALKYGLEPEDQNLWDTSVCQAMPYYLTVTFFISWKSYLSSQVLGDSQFCPVWLWQNNNENL